MKRSELEGKIAELEPKLLKLEGINAMHHMKRPAPYRGDAEKLRKELAAARGRMHELRAWLRGNWFEDDTGAGGVTPKAGAQREVTR